MKMNSAFPVLRRYFSAAFLLLGGASAPAQNAALLNDLVSYWPLNVIEGTKTPDLKSGFDLTLQNFTATDVVPGIRGNALSFDRTRDMLASRLSSATEDLPVGRHPSFTISLWAKLSSTGQNSLCLFAEGNSTTTTPFTSLRTDNRVAGGQNSSLLTANRPNAGGSAIITRSDAQPLDGVDWHHLVLVQTDGGDGTATRTVYIDGVADPAAGGTGWPSKPATEVYSLDTTALGGLRRSTNGSYVSGLIDDVAVWKRALTAAEVEDLKLNGLPPIGPPPEPLRVNAFRGDFNRVAPGRPITLTWDVTRDATITITPEPGNVTPISSFGVGSTVVTPAADTIYTLTLTRGAEEPVTADFSVSILEGVTAGWDLLDTFQFRTPGNLGGQYPWITGNGFWQVEGEGSTGNRISRPTPQESICALPLSSRRVLPSNRATLFGRFLVPATVTADLNLIVGLSDKVVRFGSDWAVNNGPVIRLFRTAGGAPVLQARNGQGSPWTDAPLALIQGTPYNIWIDVENVDGVGDVYSVHAGAVGSARTTLFSNFISDRLESEVPFLGFPGPNLNSLVFATPTGSQAGAVLLDDFFLSTGNAFNLTEPIPSSLTLQAPPLPFEVTHVTFDPTTGDLTLRWNSLPGATYTLEASPSMEEMTWAPVATGLASQGITTETLYAVPQNERGKYFYRIRVP